MGTDKKYYWLKLKKDFFKRHDIQIIEAMPNGKDYILFYLKLLVESVDHEGALRFSDAIPYNEQMLATITNTDIDKVRSAMRVFTELKMIEVLDDETIFMAEVTKMLGHETHWAEAKRNQRSKGVGQCPQLVQNVQGVSRQEIELEKEIEIEKDQKSRGKKFTPPSLQEVAAYCFERNNSIDPQRFIDYYESNGWMIGKSKMKDWKAAIRNWERRSLTNQKPAVKQTGLDYLQSIINGGPND